MIITFTIKSDTWCFLFYLYSFSCPWRFYFLNSKSTFQVLNIIIYDFIIGYVFFSLIFIDSLGLSLTFESKSLLLYVYVDILLVIV